MYKTLLNLFLNSCSDNPKRKTYTELSRNIQNLECVAIVTIGVTLAVGGGGVAQAQPAKIGAHRLSRANKRSYNSIRGIPTRTLRPRLWGGKKH
jgi:hypothetical protein